MRRSADARSAIQDNGPYPNASRELRQAPTRVRQNRHAILKWTKRNLTDGAVEKTDPKGKRGFEDHWAWKDHEAGGGSTRPQCLYRGKSPEAHLQKAWPALHGRTGRLRSQGNERSLIIEFIFYFRPLPGRRGSWL